MPLRRCSTPTLHRSSRAHFGYFAVATELNPLLHTWSLSVEEQFYFVIPMLLFISWRVGMRRPGRPVRALRISCWGFALSLEACLVPSAGHSIGEGAGWNSHSSHR
ncbi:MAG: hypothetical protein R2789_19120 [Microthrixaceae bacterium]